LHERYIENMVAKTRAAFRHTTGRSVFIASIWSSLSLLSPAFWRKWDKPVLEAVIQTAHECGGLVHHHFHGRCMKVLPELAALGLDCICPFERPPGGDVTDLRAVAKLLGNRTTFNGNVHTVATLIQGTPTDVRREVLDILEAFEGSHRLIVGTGDQVGYETPESNIIAMIETARQYGRS
jgi:uroporphyrinogen-III decarboxylase